MLAVISSSIDPLAVIINSMHMLCDHQQDSYTCWHHPQHSMRGVIISSIDTLAVVISSLDPLAVVISSVHMLASQVL